MRHPGFSTYSAIKMNICLKWVSAVADAFRHRNRNEIMRFSEASGKRGVRE